MRFIVLSIAFIGVLVSPVQGEEGAAKFVRAIGYNDEVSGKLETIPGWSHKTMIFNDPASPVQIVKTELYNIGMAYHSRYSKIPAWLVFITAKGKSVASVKYGMLLYDSWEELSDGMTAVDMHFKSGLEAEWQKFRALPPSFKRFGIGCLFVRAARMNNGKIWRMNAERIARMMEKRGCGTKNRKEIEKAVRSKNKGSLRL